MNNNVAEILGLGVLGCLAVIVLVALWWAVLGFIIMIIWNALLPYLLGAPVLSYAQGVAVAVGLSIVGWAFKTVVYSGK